MHQQNQIERLKQNIHSLVIKYRKTNEKKNSLENEVVELKKEIEALKKDNSDLNEKLNKLKLAKNLSESLGGSHDAKIKVNRIVREIDKCIALLNR